MATERLKVRETANSLSTAPIRIGLDDCHRIRSKHVTYHAPLSIGPFSVCVFGSQLNGRRLMRTREESGGRVTPTIVFHCVCVLSGVFSTLPSLFFHHRSSVSLQPCRRRRPLTNQHRASLFCEITAQKAVPPLPAFFRVWLPLRTVGFCFLRGRYSATTVSDNLHWIRSQTPG